MVHDLAEWKKVRAKCLWVETKMESRLTHPAVLWAGLGRSQHGVIVRGSSQSLHKNWLDSHNRLSPGTSPSTFCRSLWRNKQRLSRLRDTEPGERQDQKCNP